MPVFASFFAWIIRSELVDPWTAFCGLIIVAGIVLANRRGMNTPETKVALEDQTD